MTDYSKDIDYHKKEIEKLESEKQLMEARSNELKENSCFRETKEHLTYGGVFVYRKILKIISDNQIFEERFYHNIRKQYNKEKTSFEEPFIGRGTGFKSRILEACEPCSNEEYDEKKEFILQKFRNNSFIVPDDTSKGESG